MQDVLVEKRTGAPCLGRRARRAQREAGAQDSYSYRCASVATSGWAETGDVFVVAFPLERTSWWSPDPGWDTATGKRETPTTAIAHQQVQAFQLGAWGWALTTN